MHCKYLPLSHTKPYKTFLRLCMGQRKGTYSAQVFRPVAKWVRSSAYACSYVAGVLTCLCLCYAYAYACTYAYAPVRTGLVF